MQVLEAYKISSVTGCLLGQPTPTPKPLQPYKALLDRSGELLRCSKIREAIEKLPLLDTAQLKNHQEKRLAHKIFAFLATQYVWQNGDNDPAEILPAVIAIPLMEVSIQLGCQPLLGHVDLVLSNCFPEKTQPNQRQDYFVEFTPSDEPNWLPFIEGTANVELAFGQSTKTMLNLVDAVKEQHVKKIIQCLTHLTQVISTMRVELMKIIDELDARAFYVEMRPFLSGWSHGKISKGVVYEGVPDSVLTGAENELSEGTLPKRRVYFGASAGQSISLECFDAILGIEHFQEIKDSMATVRKYMIREHCCFVEDLWKHAHVRDFVKGNESEELKKAYNGCVEGLFHFRTSHLELVRKFITEPSQRFAANVESLKTEGTGGTDMNGFLGLIIEKTKQALL